MKMGWVSLTSACDWVGSLLCVSFFLKWEPSDSLNFFPHRPSHAHTWRATDVPHARAQKGNVPGCSCIDRARAFLECCFLRSVWWFIERRARGRGLYKRTEWPNKRESERMSFKVLLLSNVDEKWECLCGKKLRLSDGLYSSSPCSSCLPCLPVFLCSSL